ncbi:MAG: hypothetical protein QOE57_1875, partial [Acidimicrobiaceae bacterium]|nr:hypothetical protein [Acidimicrobiaceae bacterium]
ESAEGMFRLTTASIVLPRAVARSATLLLDVFELEDHAADSAGGEFRNVVRCLLSFW